MPKRAIILDLDGTVVDSPTQKVPTKQLIHATNDLQDKYFICAATGRAWSFAKIVLQSLKLTDPAIISGGTTICDPKTGKLLWQKTINKKAIKKVVEIMKRYPNYKIIYNDFTEDDYLSGGVSPVKFEIPDDVYFLGQIFVPDKEAISLAKSLSEVNGIACTTVVAQRDGFRDLHITHQSATKEHSIEVLLKMLKVDKKNTIGVGDGHNDLHLFASVNHKVAMGNAVPELKKAADQIIGSVKEDGITDYFLSLK